uniref:TSA: Wollemia nobilis Ref_Wollemi_Transcript_15654_1770 transcribed RNA sequence n=1 Tax=Wollemia nobilis TaxID=56998 RepID=A0A0C9QNT0_9CONI
MVLECAVMVPEHPQSESSPSKAQAPAVPAVASIARDVSKKKKVNRRAKLKQCKLDARREQWLSQGKNKIIGQQHQCQHQNGNSGNGDNHDHDNDKQSNEATNSEGSNHNNSPREHVEMPRRSFSDMDSRSSKASIEEEEYDNEGCSSEDLNSKSPAHESSQEEEDDDGSSDVEDDWEAAADALDVKESPPKPVNEETPCVLKENNTTDNNNNKTPFSIEVGILKPEYKIKPTSAVNRSSRVGNARAWRPDDASRPKTLPNLTKVHSFPSQSCRPWGAWNTNHNSSPALSAPVPLSCPICYEDLDVTDFNFMPCSCGFRLCLFCHKRILEQDARCPGCRTRYNVTDTTAKVAATVRLPRSYSLRLRV